jgi:hypothetical protein
MSPFLFLLVAENLSNTVQDGKREEHIKVIKIRRSCSLSHLLFEDDVLLFGAGTVRGRKV